jgi:hypothetical protein
MKILLRNDKKDAWKLVESAAYKGENELQRLLAESPSLISIEDVRAGAGQLVVAVREFPLPIGFLDLVAFSAAGDITLIECKLASNPQIKREVIGQALEYGAHLWQMSYEDLDQAIQQRTNKPLAELMHAALGDSDWDEETFRVNIESALADGSFILIIVVDEITEELSRIIHFVNNCGHPVFTFAALEMQRYQSDKTEMLVPRVVGDTLSSTAGNGNSRTRWTEDTFLKDATNKLDLDTLQTIKLLYDWSKKHANLVRFGTGSANGSYTFLFEKNGKTGSVFSIYTNGALTINFGYMEEIFSENDIASFRQELSTISAFGNILTSRNYYYTVKIASVFPKQENMEHFQEIVLGLKKFLP